MSKITEDELATLSDEERAALEGHEDDDPIDSVNDDDDPADDSSDPPEDKADKKDEAPAEDPPKDETPFAVPFQHRSSINMEEAGKQLEALQKQYDDGELDMAEFLSKRDEIREKIIADKLATQISEQSQDQVAAALWGQAVQNFLDSRVGAAYKGDPVLWSTLDNVVKTMAQDDANANLSDKQLIEKAHEEVAKRFRVDGAKPTVTPKQEVADKRRPSLGEVPRTLRDAPAAADNSAADNEFANLDALQDKGDSAAFERALAKLTPDQQERYLRG